MSADIDLVHKLINNQPHSCLILRPAMGGELPQRAASICAAHLFKWFHFRTLKQMFGIVFTN